MRMRFRDYNVYHNDRFIGTVRAISRRDAGFRAYERWGAITHDYVFILADSNIEV